MFVITSHDTNSDGVWVHTCEVTRLDDSSVQSGTSAATQIDMTISGQTPLKISDASQNFLGKTGVLGPFFYFQNIEPTNITLCKNWITQHYGETAPVVNPNAENAKFYGELQVS